jgi:type VI secretion system secreted protein Hcp
MAIYLKLDGVDGESEKKGHEKWIEVQSFSWGANQNSTVGVGGGLSAGTVSFQDVSIQAMGGKSSSLLLHFLTKGKHFSEITIDFTKSTGDNPEEIYQQIRSKSGYITSYNASMQGGDYEAVPMDSVTMALANYEHEIWAQETEGGALKSCGVHGYDLKLKEAK